MMVSTENDDRRISGVYPQRTYFDSKAYANDCPRSVEANTGQSNLNSLAEEDVEPNGWY